MSGGWQKAARLRRFITAKDDNWQKTLAWGVLTDDDDVVHLSLRDFRPHVAALAEQGRAALADQLAQDFLDAYADGFNAFVRELREITAASRETRSDRLAKDDELMSLNSDPLIGQYLDHILVQQPLGRGGMARIYKGYDTLTQACGGGQGHRRGPPRIGSVRPAF